MNATAFETSCLALGSQLTILEEELNEVLITPVRSQPLKTLAEQTKVHIAFNKLYNVHVHVYINVY